MSKREPIILLQDIVESIEKIKSYTEEMSLELFTNDDKTIDAVIRNFEIIGEATNRIPNQIKEEFNEINWHRIKGFRNRLVHDYMGVDLGIIWEIIENDIDELHNQILEIIEKLGNRPQ
jgi:uncharacterized protein with HEPN domain